MLREQADLARLRRPELDRDLVDRHGPCRDRAGPARSALEPEVRRIPGGRVETPRPDRPGCRTIDDAAADEVEPAAIAGIEQAHGSGVVGGTAHRAMIAAGRRLVRLDVILYGGETNLPAEAYRPP